jgi:8-oxo-dGTP pyrophosphatase MutT (NUDIX family)
MKLEELQVVPKSKTIRAGFIPYIIEDDEPVFLFMVPSDGQYGGLDPQIAKGRVEDGEDVKGTAIREAEEELGLKFGNLKMDTVQKTSEKQITGMTATYTMVIYIGEVKSKEDFGKFHYETESTHWLTYEEYKVKGKKSQMEFVTEAYNQIKG